MIFCLFLIVLLFTEKNCQKADPSNNIDQITNIMVNLISETLTLSIDKAINKSILAGDQKITNDLKQCKKELEIFNYDEDEEESHKYLRKYYTYLIYYESSKSKNDLGEYLDCLESQTIDIKDHKFNYSTREQIKANSTFTIFKIIEEKNKSFSDFRFKDNEYLFGLCLKKGCSENSIKDIFYEFNNELVLFENLKNSEFNVYNLDSRNDLISFRRLIPIITTILIILLTPIAFILKKYCLKENSKLDNFFGVFNFNINFKRILGEKNSQEDPGLKIIRGVRGIILISLVVSISFIYIYHLPTKVFNEINMEYLLSSAFFPAVYHGERFGKKILFALSGIELVYKMLSYLDKQNEDKNKTDENEESNKDSNKIVENTEKNKPGNKCEKNKSNDDKEVNIINDGDEDEDEEDNKDDINTNNDKNQVVITEKENEFNIALNFFQNTPNNSNVDLGEEGEEEEEKEEKKEEEKEEEKYKQETKNSINNYTENNTPKAKERNSSISLNEFADIEFENFEEKDNYEKIRKNLKLKDLIIWYLKQIYKYFLLVFAIFLYKYGTIYPFLLLKNISPIWILYFDDISKAFTNFHIVANLFFFSNFSYKGYYWLNPFGLAVNEIVFFILGSLLIFICYKNCLRLDIFILVLFFILFTMKIILAFFIYYDDNLNYYPAMFFQNDNSYVKTRSYLSYNPFMKLDLFLIGMFFGEVFYCIEKPNKSKEENKKYLIIPKKFSESKFVKIFHDPDKCITIFSYIILIILFGSYIGIVYIYEIMIKYFMKDKNNSKYYTFFSDKQFNIISLFDGDIGVFILLLIILFLFFDKNIIFSKFLEHDYWKIVYKPYWSNLLLLHISATFIFYYSENRIKLVLNSIIFLAFQILILLTLLAILFFALIEMPFKQINEIIINKLFGK